MWDNSGFEVHGRKKIYKGPGLQRIMSSHMAYLTGDALPREFWNDSSSFYQSDKCQKLCVAGVEPVGPQGINLKLVSHPGQESHCYYIIYGYNHVRHRGNMEEYWKAKDTEPFAYEPATLPDTGEMMMLEDNGFIMVYALHMLSYKRSERYDFPIRCGRPGCKNFIRHHLDMRKLGGQCLCPECFVEAVTTRERSNEFLMRAAKILPNRPLAVLLWTKGVMDEDSVLTRR